MPAIHSEKTLRLEPPEDPGDFGPRGKPNLYRKLASGDILMFAGNSEWILVVKGTQVGVDPFADRAQVAAAILIAHQHDQWHLAPHEVVDLENELREIIGDRGGSIPNGYPDLYYMLEAIH